MSRTSWYVVNVQIELRIQERVQYAQDDIKTETLEGTKIYPMVFALEVDQHSSDDYLNEVAGIYLKNIFRHRPRLGKGRSATFEVKEIKFTAINGVFRAVGWPQ